MHDDQELYRLRGAVNDTYADLRRLALNGAHTYNNLGIATDIRVDVEGLNRILSRLDPLRTFGGAPPTATPLAAASAASGDKERDV